MSSRFETRTPTWYRSAQIVRRTYFRLFMHTRFAQRREIRARAFVFVPTGCARARHSRTSHRSRWRPLKPGERSGFAPRCVPRALDASRRASFVAGSDRTRRTLNCFLLCANPTHANRAPASALARSDRTSSVPSRAGVPHLGGHRRRRLAVRVLLHQADHHLPRLPVRSVPASAPRSLLSGQIFRRVRSSPRASPCRLAARAPRRRAHPARHRARCAFEPRARVPRANMVGPRD